MGKINIAAREYFSDNVRFADIFNFYLFAGKNVIIPSALYDIDSVENVSFGEDN